MSRLPGQTYEDWLLSLRGTFGARDRLGTANYIDGAARQRGRGAIVTGETVGLARPLRPGPSPRGDDRPAFAVEVFYTDGPIGMGSDHLELDCHGRNNTHIDALNHLSVDGQWYGGWAVDDPDAPNVADLANHNLFTRGVLADIPRARGTAWAEAEEPVTGADIDHALGSTAFEPGDALLLYMGRDRYEAAGNHYEGLREGGPQPGVGGSAAEWMADNKVSLLCWDFLDSSHPQEPFACTHRLLWALGLVLVDNCNLADAAALAQRAGRITGALTVAALAVPGGTGCTVRPLFVM